VRLLLDTNVVVSALLVSGDADDDQIIAAAVAARADLIVSGDRRHLLTIGVHEGIAIVDAGEAIRRISAG
jgi:predicted nucleic acid-binding protein